MEDLINNLPLPESVRNILLDAYVKPYNYNGPYNENKEKDILTEFNGSEAPPIRDPLGSLKQTIVDDLTGNAITEEALENFTKGVNNAAGRDIIPELPDTLDALTKFINLRAGKEVIPELGVGKDILYKIIDYLIPTEILDQTYSFNIPIDVTLPIIQTGQISLTLYSGATTLPGDLDYALSDYSKTFKLESITVPQTFTGIDSNNLKVVFDTGLEVPASRSDILTPNLSSSDFSFKPISVSL